MMTKEELHEFAATIADAVSSKVEAKLNVYIARKDAECAAHHGKTHNHERTLYGNGMPGLKTEVEQLKVANKILCFITGAVFIAVVGPVIIKMIETFFKA
jgi:hypothetical protein